MQFMMHVVTTSGREYDSVWQSVDDETLDELRERLENRLGWLSILCVNGNELYFQGDHVESVELRLQREKT